MVAPIAVGVIVQRVTSRAFLEEYSGVLFSRKGWWKRNVVQSEQLETLYRTQVNSKRPEVDVKGQFLVRHQV